MRAVLTLRNGLWRVARWLYLLLPTFSSGVSLMCVKIAIFHVSTGQPCCDSNIAQITAQRFALLHLLLMLMHLLLFFAWQEHCVLFQNTDIYVSISPVAAYPH